MDILTNHRSIRKYTSREITDDTLNAILEAGARASNTGNMQLYSIVVTRNADIKQALAPAHFNQPMITGAPVVLTFCADINRFKKWCLMNNAEVGFNNFESFVTAAIDASLVAQNVCVAAEAQGLGICYLGTTTYNTDKIIEVLNLPAGVVPITTVTLGYPAEEPELTERLPLEAVVHADTYTDYTNDDIARLYAEKESLPQNQKFVAENNKANLAQVFAEVRYTKANNEHFSKVLLDALKKQEML